MDTTKLGRNAACRIDYPKLSRRSWTLFRRYKLPNLVTRDTIVAPACSSVLLLLKLAAHESLKVAFVNTIRQTFHVKTFSH